MGQAKTCSGAGDSFTYDALGRQKTTTHSDGASVQVAYTGRATQVTDEGNGTSTVSRILQSDALGRMSSACEIYSGTALMGSTGTPSACGLDISGTGFITNYAYDVLDNSTTITQGGQTRSYVYDSLSRLTQETIPEKSGATYYTYNSDGLVYQRTRPAPNQSNPATTVTTTYTYDELHRPRTAAYSDGVTPSPQWHYDEVFVSGWGVNLTNTKGNLSQEVVGSTGSTFSYDSMGRVAQNYQCTPRTCFSNAYRLDYTYDLLGNALTGSNGVGTTLSYGYNAAARLTTMTSSWIDANHPGTLLSNVHYGAFGLSGSSLGNGLTEAATYNALGKLSSFTAAQSGTTRYSFGLSYAPDGNITSGNDSQNGNWTYTYDPFNRLKTATQSGQGLNWDYDRFGNRWHQTVSLGSGGQSSLSFSGGNNHVDGETYDAAGNVTNVGSRVYTYDAENRLIAVSGDTTASYVYDPEGRRVKTQAYEYLYDDDGRAIAVLNTSNGTNVYDEIFAGGRHLATYSNSTTSFNHTDWLGTERVRTGPAGAVAETCTNLPFGDGQTCTGTDSSRIHFTGHERGTETGLDDTLFRQYQSLEARWLSVDPLGGNFSNPQTLNRYEYVENDPVRFADPLGLSTSFDGSFCLYNVTYSQKTGKIVNVDLIFCTSGWGNLGNPGRPANTATISAYHPSVSTCSGQAAIDFALDMSSLSLLPGANQDDWQWSSAKFGFVFTGAGASKSALAPSTAVNVVDKGAHWVAGSSGAQKEIRQLLRSEGVKISMKHVGKDAAVLGKVAGVFGAVLAAKSAYDRYKKCRGY